MAAAESCNSLPPAKVKHHLHNGISRTDDISIINCSRLCKENLQSDSEHCVGF